LLVTGDADRWSPISETLLMYAARRDHIERVIVPALERGDVVVCDRYADSTRAYQGAGGGAPPSLIEGLEEAVLGAARPDLTLILDLPVETGLSRTTGRPSAETRFEARDLAFHGRIREAFRSLARAEPGRCLVIDAAADADAVAAAIWAVIGPRLGERPRLP
jgi:dTMP kinase